MVATLRCPCSGRQWSTKQYILVALFGTLVAIAVASTISIILAPGHVSFSIAKANMTVLNRSDFYMAFYNFTLMANNTSQRMAVRYGTLVAEIWYTEASWVPTDEIDTATTMSGWWPPAGANSTAMVRIGADWSQHSEAANETVSGQNNDNQKRNDTADKGNIIKWPYCRVHLEAKVWFRYGLVPTMPYTIRASCFPVNFRDGVDYTINCTSS